MAAPISTYLANKLLDHLLGGSDYTSPVTLYLALFTVTPTDAGGGTEASGSNYSRLAITNNPTNFPAAASGSKSNGTPLTMFTANGSIASIVALGIFDASSGGNLLWWGPVDTPATIANGDTPTFAVGTLVLGLGGSFGSTIRNSLLDLVFGRVSYVRPSTVYGALSTAPFLTDGTGGGAEVSGGSYVRKSIANNSTNFPAAASSSKSLNVLQTFIPATADWGTVTDLALYDAVSSGNLLFFKTLTTARAVLSGQTFRLAATALSVTLE